MVGSFFFYFSLHAEHVDSLALSTSSSLSPCECSIRLGIFPRFTSCLDGTSHLAHRQHLQGVLGIHACTVGLYRAIAAVLASKSYQ